jgi:hypothetical protein
MATSRPFAYNPGGAISGATQSGNLAIGTASQDYSKNLGGVKWFMGPDEDLGYVMALAVTGGNYPTPDGQNNGNVQFWRSAAKTDESFRLMSNSISFQFGGSGPFASANAAKTWLDASGFWTTFLPFSAGLYKTTYSGYFADNVSFFATATPASVGGNPATSVQTTEISEPAQNDGENFSCQWLGYFKPTTTETYTFFTTSDDASYVWVGATAVSGFTTSNPVVNNGGLHGSQEASGTIALTAGVYYPIRIQFGELSGGDVMTFAYSTPTITKTTTVTGLVFYSTSTNGF